jgi:hypothetical protein
MSATVRASATVRTSAAVATRSPSAALLGVRRRNSQNCGDKFVKKDSTE